VIRDVQVSGRGLKPASHRKNFKRKKPVYLFFGNTVMPSGSLDSLNLPFVDQLLQGGIPGAENLRGFTWGEELWRVNDPG
jgi:hypothetical protein